MSGIESSAGDGEIVAAVLEGNRERFAEIVWRYYRPLLRVVRSRVGPFEPAEDVVQDSFLCALKSLHTYNSAYSFRTWLWTIVLNQCRRYYAKRMKRSAIRTWSERAAEESAIEQVDQRHPTPLGHAISNERRQSLERLLDDLPAVQADALRLRFFGQLKFQEIADTMQCSLSTAKHRVRVGLRQMSQAIMISARHECGEVENEL